MTAAFTRRVAALDHALAGHGGCHVITYKLAEPPAAALARATAAGLRGGFLLLPEVMTPGEWTTTARAQQRQLLEACHA
jgi:hypothetical protein